MKRNITGRYGEGQNLRTNEVGRFYSRDVEVQVDIVDRFEISIADVAEDAPLICALMREDQLRSGDWWKPTEEAEVDAVVDDVYTRVYMFILNNQGERIFKEKNRKRHCWTYLKPAQAPFTVYLLAEGDGKGKRFQLQCMAPHGSVQVKQMPCTYSEFIKQTNYTYVIRRDKDVFHGKREMI